MLTATATATDDGSRAGVAISAIRAAGLVRRASEHDHTAVERSLPVSAALRPLFPGGCLRRGSTVLIAGPSAYTTAGSARLTPRERPSHGAREPGATSLLFALLAEASAAGSWCAAVGLPTLGLVAAAEAGVAVERFALVPHPGPEWTGVVAALLDGVEIVVAAVPGSVPARVAERLAARARQRGAVLVPIGRWPGADLTLEVVDGAWHGLDHGRGRLRAREARVAAYGRGAAARTRYADLWLPGGVAPPDPRPARWVGRGAA
jgi:hypothetical protein